MPEERKPQTADKYIIRFPEGMREQIAKAAKGNNRTMNAEIVARLQASLASVPGFQPALQQQQEQLAQLLERRNTLVLLLGAVDAKTAPSEEVLMLKRRLAEIELSIANTERRINQFSQVTS